VEVRAWLRERLQAWDGRDPERGNAWLQAALQGLAPAHHVTARLALLTAVAPQRVGTDVVQAFNLQHPGDAALLGALAWSSFAAARRIGAWLVPAT
jgi:hypothetical protein